MPIISNDNIASINFNGGDDNKSGPTSLPVSRISNTSKSVTSMVTEHPNLVKFGLLAIGAVQAKELYSSISNGDIASGIKLLCSSVATYLSYKAVDVLVERDALLKERDIEVRLNALKQDAMIDKKFEYVFGHAPSSPIDCFEEPARLTDKHVSGILYGGSDNDKRLEFAVAQAKLNFNLDAETCISIRTIITALSFGLLPKGMKQEIFNAGGQPALTFSIMQSLTINQREHDALTSNFLDIMKVPDHPLPSQKLLSTEEIEARLAALKR